MEDSSELRLLAQKCRRLADAISDGPARENLLSLAAEYEERIPGIEAARQDQTKPVMPWARA
jgi:sigma54-dependent transcription regulator